MSDGLTALAPFPEGALGGALATASGAGVGAATPAGDSSKPINCRLVMNAWHMASGWLQAAANSLGTMALRDSSVAMRTRIGSFRKMEAGGQRRSLRLP